MRIVHISDCYLPRLGGIEQQVSGLAKAQVAAGHDVHVITATEAGAAAVEELDGVTVHRITFALPQDFPWHPLAGFVIRRKLVELAPDVAHAHVGAAAQFAWGGMRAAEDLNLPTVTTVHSMWGPISRWFYSLWRVLLQWPAGTLITAVSSECAKLVRGSARAEVTVIGNGVDLAGWQAAARTPHQPLRLVSATRFAPRKRVFALLKVMRELHARLGADCPHLSIAGAGGQLERARSYIDRHGLQDVVRLCGRLPRPELAALYAESDVFVQLSVRESFGLAAIEARAAGLPVIGRSGNGLSEFVNHGTNGWLLDSDAAAVELLAELSKQPQMVAEFQQNSANNPPQHTWQQAVRDFDRTYAEALAYAAQHG